MTEPALYAVVGEPEAGMFTLADFIAANEYLAQEDRDAIAALDLGQTVVLGGGAAAAATIERVR